MAQQPDVIVYSDNEDDEYVYPADYQPSDEYFNTDDAMPPPADSELMIHPALMPNTLHDILLLDRHSTSYHTIEHVLNEFIRDSDTYKSYVHDNKVVLIYNTALKVAVCTKLVTYESKLITFFSFCSNFISIFNFVLLLEKTKIARPPVPADTANRLAHSNTVATCVKDFFNNPEFADLTLVVSVGEYIYII